MEITIEQILEIASTYKINNNGFYEIEDLSSDAQYNFRIENIKRIIPFIKRYCKPIKNVNKKRSLTQMKNILSNFIESRFNLNNGEFAIAMILSGFEPKKGYFAYSEKEFSVLDKYILY